MSEKLTNRQVDQYIGISNFAKRHQNEDPNENRPIKDSDEAYEVAHATKELEEKHAENLGHWASIAAENAELDSEGNVTNRYPGSGDEFAAMRHRSAVYNRGEADKLGALVSEAYKNGAEFLDLSSDEFATALAEAPVYRKAAIVKARRAVPGEVIVTVTPDGVEEGRNTAGEDDHVVTGANGADFILPGEKFNKLYEETEEPGVFQSRGMARIIDNPTGKKIGILAPWGEMQYGDGESKIAVQYDPQNPNVVGTDRYILDKTEFEAYKPLEQADA